MHSSAFLTGRHRREPSVCLTSGKNLVFYIEPYSSLKSCSITCVLVVRNSPVTGKTGQESHPEGKEMKSVFSVS